jgi:hypothetical protein
VTLLEDRLQEAVDARRSAPDSRSFVRSFARERVLRHQLQELEWRGEQALYRLEERTFSTEKRAKLAKKGHAMPGGRYPIENAGDLENAIQAYGRGSPSDLAAIKAYIIKRARALKLVAKLPPAWNVSTA